MHTTKAYCKDSHDDIKIPYHEDPLHVASSCWKCRVKNLGTSGPRASKTTTARAAKVARKKKPKKPEWRGVASR